MAEWVHEQINAAADRAQRNMPSGLVLTLYVKPDKVWRVRICGRDLYATEDYQRLLAFIVGLNEGLKVSAGVYDQYPSDEQEGEQP